MNVIIEKKAHVTTIIINRPKVRNAVDLPTAKALADAFREFEADGDAKVTVLTGADNFFCAGYDLKSMANGAFQRWETDEDAPMGPFRMKKIGTTLSCLNITIYPREISRYPKFTKPFLYYLIIKPSLQKYLSSVLNGFHWYITKNERVKKNQFGTHKWFSD